MCLLEDSWVNVKKMNCSLNFKGILLTNKPYKKTNVHISHGLDLSCIRLKNKDWTFYSVEAKRL